jgi:hypothetical protein
VINLIDNPRQHLAVVIASHRNHLDSRLCQSTDLLRKNKPPSELVTLVLDEVSGKHDSPNVRVERVVNGSL